MSRPLQDIAADVLAWCDAITADEPTAEPIVYVEDIRKLCAAAMRDAATPKTEARTEYLTSAENRLS